jgi:hypothetical protein
LCPRTAGTPSTVLTMQLTREACIKYALVDMFGTPFPEKLHVVECCRLIDFEEVRKAWRATQRRTGWPARSTVKHLQVRFTVGDEGAFTTPWTRTSPMGWGPTTGRKFSVQKYQDVLRTRRRRSDGGEAGFLTHLLRCDLLLTLCR